MTRLLLLIMATACAALGRAADDGVSITTFDADDGFAESRVSCMLQDSVGYIWIATWDGLYRYDGYRLHSYKARPGDGNPLDINRIDHIYELPGGDILCRVRSEYYALRRSTGRFELYTGDKDWKDIRYWPDSAANARVAVMPRYQGIVTRIVLEDRQGGTWVYSSLGLDRIAPAAKPIANRKAGSEREEVARAMMEDSGGHIWVADTNGYVRIAEADGLPFAHLGPDGRVTADSRRFGHKVYCLLEDGRGSVWMGCKPGGIFRLKPRGGGFAVEHFTHREGHPMSLPNDNVYALAEDSHGHLWVGTYGHGLCVASIDRPEDGFMSAASGLPSLHDGDVQVTRLLVTRGDTLLVGTNNGLYYAPIEADARQMVFQSCLRDPFDAHTLSSNRVTDIVQLASGQVWVATYGGGICQMHHPQGHGAAPSFTPITTEQGLSSDVVMGAIEDHQGQLWVVSGASLSRLDPQAGVVTNFRRSMFSGGFVFSEAHPIVTADGDLMIGTSQGTLEFNPKQLRKSDFCPPIVTNVGSAVTMKSTDRTLLIAIAALDYNKNEPIEYAYMMEGVDQDWNYITDTYIRYANIPAGDHRLLIRSTNGDGIWVDNEVAVVVSRPPMLTERPLFWMVIGCVLLMVAYAVARVTAYVRRLEREVKDAKLTTNEKLEYAWLKTAERGEAEPSAEGVGDWAEQVVRLTQERIADPDLSVDVLAREMSMSRSAFYLAMKRQMGMTPNAYIQQKRMEMAKRLLAQGRDNVSEVAYKCGFADPKYFSRCFKKMVGVTPSEYLSAKGERADRDGQ